MMHMLHDPVTGFAFSDDCKPSHKIMFLASHLDHIGKTTGQFELMDLADQIMELVEQICPGDFEDDQHDGI
jgi:hypothetical protein